jgi:1-acyl-sn-glycerol-3-phosphate acyltransferase
MKTEPPVPSPADPACRPAAPRRSRWRLRDPLITAALGIYFGLGFFAVYVPRLLWLALRRRGEARTRRVQALMSEFLRGFFGILGALGRPARVAVPDSVRALRGRVLLCNHVSYLDPLLFVASFARHGTVVKPVWFRVPFFGWILRAMGYFAPLGSDATAPTLAERVDALRAHLAAGGVLFVFPEGRRSRDGHLGPFDPGGLKLARLLGADVELLRVHGTDAVFPPGAHGVRTGGAPVLRFEPIGRLDAAELRAAASLKDLAQAVEQRYRQHPAPPPGAPAASAEAASPAENNGV